MNARSLLTYLLPAIGCLVLVGCAGHTPHEQKLGTPYDRPFPLGQVTDAAWETQQTNAEASDFIFYDHEFEGETTRLTPGGKKHLLQVALRLEHVPFPVVVEESPYNKNRRLDLQRRQAIVDQLTRLGLELVDSRVVVAPALSEGLSAIEGEAAYYGTLNSGEFATGGGTGRRFSGRGGSFR